MWEGRSIGQKEWNGKSNRKRDSTLRTANRSDKRILNHAQAKPIALSRIGIFDKACHDERPNKTQHNNQDSQQKNASD